MNRILPQRLLVLIISVCTSLVSHAIGVGGSGMFQYSVQLTDYISPETGKVPVAYLWVPEDCKQIRATILCQQNMTEEAIIKSPLFQQRMQKLGIAMIWVAPAFSNNWDPATGCQTIFENLMVGLSNQSGHPELRATPVIPLGHSAQATFPWNFAAWNPDRTLCILSFHGDAPRTNLCGYGTDNVEWGRTRNIDGIPGLMVEGEYEWWEARVRPALAFRMMYPGSCISFLCDTGRGHFDCGERTINYLALYIEKVMKMRLQSDGTLRKVNVDEGWYFSRFHADMVGTDGEDKGKMPEAFGDYEKPVAATSVKSITSQPTLLNSFWYPDQKLADMVFDRYHETQGKLPLTFTEKILPEWSADGKSFTIKLPALPSDYKGKLHTEVICGGIKKMNDTIFTIYPYECGYDNPRRSYSAWLAIVAEPNKKYKGGVLPVSITLPHISLSR